LAGSTQTLNVTIGGTAFSGSIWIDFNQNSTYEASEWFDLGRNIPASGSVAISIPVPATAISGRTGARVRFRLPNNPNGDIDACTGFGSGYSYDFSANITAATACSAVPAVPTLSQSVANICPSDSLLINYTNAGPFSGINLQWQFSTDNGSTWAPAPGANSNSYYLAKPSLLGSVNGLIRLSVGCAAVGTPVFSSSVAYSIKPSKQCYCKPLLTSTCTNGIQLVTLSSSTGFNPALPTTCTGNGYYTLNTQDTLRVLNGLNNTLSFTTGTTTATVSLWIDADTNGVFDASEWIDLGRNVPINTLRTVTFVGPSVTGNIVTNARIKVTSFSVNTSTNACNTYFTGQVIDFVTKLVQPIACNAAANPAVISANVLSTCKNSPLVFTSSGLPITSGNVLAWEVSTDNGTTWAAAGPFATDPSLSLDSNDYGPATKISVRLKVTCSASSQASYSNVVTVNIDQSIRCSYCKPAATATCTNGIQLVSISSAGFNPTLPTACSGNGFYSNNITDTLKVLYGIGNTISFRTGATGGSVSLWIDYNANGTYESTEWVDLGRTVPSNTSVSVLFTGAPGTTNLLTYARIKITSFSINGSPNACNTYTTGQVIDFIAKLIVPAACNAAPSPATISSNITSICKTGSVVFNSADLPNTTGNVLAWELSTDNGATWRPANAFASDPSLSLDSNDFSSAPKFWVRLKVTCSASNLFSFSNVITINVDQSSRCNFCKPDHSSCLTSAFFSSLYSVSQGFYPTLPTICAGNTTGLFYLGGTAATDTLILTRGDADTLSLTAASGFIGSVWIDYDNNGSFSATEHTQFNTAASGITRVNISVPSSSVLGSVAGRVRTRSTGSPNGPGDACTDFFSGVGYDFPVRIGTVVSIPSKLGSIAIGLYPNPASGSVIVELPNAESAKFTLTDFSGKMVSEMVPSAINGGQFTLPLTVAPGAYTLTVLTNTGVAHKKLIVK
jgi:hypothetical protein